ncbi:hypothetical protein GA0070611_1853 [Micromonospora auratinigra]|uniref:Uncharacterized protein n=1 Tax=Micromonospora auratinigra TaxID=261654 RepID=A0A1A8ZDL3_9ACTN|nr:hypothetical protein GA0070611_1853 [Micromonospora auratinigra]
MSQGAVPRQPASGDPWRSGYRPPGERNPPVRSHVGTRGDPDPGELRALPQALPGLHRRHCRQRNARSRRGPPRSRLGRTHRCGQQFWLSPARAGLPVTLWIDATVVHLLINGVRLKTVPSRLTPAHLRQLLADDGQPAGPPPQPASQPLQVERRVGCRGSLVIAGQRIHVGIAHAGRTLTAEVADTTFRVHDGNQLITEVAQPTTKAIARFKAREPEPGRRAADRAAGPLARPSGQGKEQQPGELPHAPAGHGPQRRPRGLLVAA